MPNPLEQARQIDTERIAKLRNDFEQVTANKENPEIQRIAVLGASALGKLAEAQGANDADLIRIQIDKIGQLHEQALEIRQRELRLSLSSLTGVSDTIDSAFNQKIFDPVKTDLKKIAKALEVDPLNVRSANDANNLFYVVYKDRNNPSDPDHKGQVFVSPYAIASCKKQLREIRRMPLNDEQKNIIDVLDNGIEQVLRFDPLATKVVAVGRAFEARKTGADFNKPLRFLGFLGAGLISSIGVGIWLRGKVNGKNYAMTWPTYVWLGITALCLNPDMLKSRGMKVVDRLATLNNKEIQTTFTTYNLSGEEGVKPVIDLYDNINDQKVANLLKLAKNGITAAQVQEIIGLKADSPLMQLMTRMKTDGERAVFLRQILAYKTKDEREVVIEYLKGRGMPGKYVPDGVEP